MKSQDYRLFPQQQVVQSTTQRSEKLFSPQQNWRQFATHQRSVESFQPPQPVTFFNQQPILQPPPAIIQQAPVKTFLPPQQFVQMLPQQIPQQVFVQQPAFSQTQQAHHQIREQNLDNRQTIQKQQQQQQAQQLAQQKAQEEQFQEQQSQSIKNINAYRQQLIQENYKEVKQNENLKQLEEKIHNEILSQSKRHNPALSQTQVQAQTQSHYILPQQVQIQQQQPQSTKSFLQSIRIHDNQTDLHLHKSKKANFFENYQAAQQQNQQYTQSQIQYVQSPYVSYVSPAPQLFTSQTKVLAPTASTPVFTTIQQQPSATALVTSQVRLFQPQLAPVPVQSTTTTILPTNPLLFNSVISNPVNPVSTYSKVITSPSKIITKPVLTKSFITSPQTQQTVLPLVLCNSQTKLTPYIPPQVLQSPKNQAQFQHEFSFQNGYRHSNTERENGLQSNFIKSIDGGFTTERVTRASKPQTVSVAAAPPQNNVDSHQQQVRNIISQSKYLLQNDILPQQQQLNQEYQGLKVYEKLGLQNRIDQDNFNQEFQKRRQEFNQRLQQCSTVHKADEVNEYREQYPANPQANLYLVQQQQQQQPPQQQQQQQQQQKVVTTITTTNVQVPIKTSQIAVSQNVSMLNNPQNESTTSNYVLAQSIDPSHSQTLKQPILHQYEQQLIIQQQSTSSYPSTSRSPVQQVSGQTEKLTFNKPAVEQQQPQEEPQNEQIKRANHPQHEQEDDEVNQESPEPSISNQIIQQQTVAATTVAAAEGNSNGVHQVISGDDVYSKQHQEFKMKFQKTKDQFYQEKSNQLSERSRQQLQQQQEQEQQELLQAHQQFLAARGTANQQLLETIVNTQQQQQQQQQQQTQQQQQVGSTSQTITTTTTTTTSTVNGTVVAQEKVSKKESVHKEAVQQVQEEEEEDSHHEQAQTHQNNEQHEQENHEIHEQIQVDKHVEDHQVQENNIDLAQAQQQFLQNRGQINQLFLQSLEKQYQNQFDNNEEDEHQQQEEQEDREEGDDVDHQQLLAEEQEEQGEYQEQLNEGEEEVDEDQQQYYEGEMNQFPADLLPPENFESEEEYHQYLEMYKQMHFQQLNYIQSQGQAGEDQAYYENQQQANGYNQLRGEDLVNFEEFQAHQNQQQHQFENQDDMNREFEQQHQYQVNQNIQMQQQQQLILNSEHQQQYQLTQEQYQQLLHQQQLQQLYEQQQHLTISQYQQQTGSPSNYDDEERLVMMRQQQLIAEKRQRDEEYKKQIEQFEQDEMLRLSSHSVGKKNSSEENN